MKRPGGFDSGPELPEPSRRVVAPAASLPPVMPAANAASGGPVEQFDTQLDERFDERVDERDSMGVGAEAIGANEPAKLVELQLPKPSALASLPTRFKVPKRRAKLHDPVKAAEKRVRAAERLNKQGQRRETRRFTSAIRRTRRRTLVAVAAVLALVLFVLVGAFTPIMAVREVQIEGAQSVNVDDVTAALQRFEGMPLALVDENEVLKALSAFPLIQRFAVERVPPSTLIVRVEERVPSVALEVDGVVRLYDAAGVLVGEAPERPAGVPLGGDSLRNTSSAAFRAASKVVRDMPADLRQRTVTVNAITGQDVVFVLDNGIEVFWGNANETRRKSLVLQTMLASLEGRAVSHIDVSSTDAPIFR